MNNKHKKILQQIFTRPIKNNIRWSDIESMLINLGCSLNEGSGSRIRFIYKKNILTVHRPHPHPEASMNIIKSVQVFLKAIGVKNDI